VDRITQRQSDLNGEHVDADADADADDVDLVVTRVVLTSGRVLTDELTEELVAQARLDAS
jgi:hypothetical protein